MYKTRDLLVLVERSKKNFCGKSLGVLKSYPIVIVMSESILHVCTNYWVYAKSTVMTKL